MAHPIALRSFLHVDDRRRCRRFPGVQAAGAVSAMPFALSNINIRSTLEVVGRPAAKDVEQRSAYVTIASPGYFSAMSIPLREGRLLEDRDSETAPVVAVISEGLRRREWPDESPVGRRVRLSWQGKPVEAEVVGVVSQIRHDGLDTAPRPEVFLSAPQFPFGSMTYVVRGAGDPRALVERVKRQIWAVDPMQPVYDAASVERLVQASVVRQRFSMSVMSAFALVALILCASGIYGIISFTTTQRTREIGLRMALGADGPTIRGNGAARGGGRDSGGARSAGVAGALAASHFLRTLLFEVRPGDPLTIASVSLLLAAVGLAACYRPARAGRRESTRSSRSATR